MNYPLYCSVSEMFAGKLNYNLKEIVRLNCAIFISCLRPKAGDYKPLLYVCPPVRPSVRSSRFYINLNISFIYEDIFTKFAGNVYGNENLSLRNFSLILKNKKGLISPQILLLEVWNLTQLVERHALGIFSRCSI